LCPKNRSNPWHVLINLPQLTHRGYYPDAVTASKVYDDAARKYLGENAVLNFPDRNKGSDDEQQAEIEAYVARAKQKRSLKEAQESGKKKKRERGGEGGEVKVRETRKRTKKEAVVTKEVKKVEEKPPVPVNAVDDHRCGW